MLDIVYGQATDPGQRSRNEDAACVFVPRSRHEVQVRGWMFALADGVGGHDAGEEASSRAVQVLAKGFAEAEEQTSLTSLLPRLIQHANAAVHDESLNPRWRQQRMATTLVVCAVRHDRATIAHVGDSRCYLVRSGRVERLTRDHSWVEEQRKEGLISESEAQESESRHVLTRTLGIERFVTADTVSISLRPLDTLILCSDGLYSKLGCERMKSAVVRHPDDPGVIAHELVRDAICLDGSDNATAVVISIRTVEAIAMYRGRQYARPGA